MNSGVYASAVMDSILDLPQTKSANSLHCRMPRGRFSQVRPHTLVELERHGIPGDLQELNT